MNYQKNIQEQFRAARESMDRVLAAFVDHVESQDRLTDSEIDEYISAIVRRAENAQHVWRGAASSATEMP